MDPVNIRLVAVQLHVEPLTVGCLTSSVLVTGRRLSTFIDRDGSTYIPRTLTTKLRRPVDWRFLN